VTCESACENAEKAGSHLTCYAAMPCNMFNAVVTAHSPPPPPPSPPPPRTLVAARLLVLEQGDWLVHFLDLAHEELSKDAGTASRTRLGASPRTLFTLFNSPPFLRAFFERLSGNAALIGSRRMPDSLNSICVLYTV
jgi:hypothetical protein